jgi:hypothetical protein
MVKEQAVGGSKPTGVLAREKVFMRELKDAVEVVGSLPAMADRLQEELCPTVYHYMIHRLDSFTLQFTRGTNTKLKLCFKTDMLVILPVLAAAASIAPVFC